ncbi:putative Cytochrome P450 [Hibiscus syriacus]|uniref:Cytochrome P450 n=1 Tax=Hibiscus syriacus TaxID=106335 RepID=A0A6A3BC06_HIBSY|nr:putative Cytochrome P450 [Hibiscus syriacus]
MLKSEAALIFQWIYPGNSNEAEQINKIGHAARPEVSRAVSEIQQSKTRLKTTQMRLLAAKKAKEAVSLAEIKTLSRKESSTCAKGTRGGYFIPRLQCVNVQGSQLSNKKLVDAMLKAKLLKMEILKKVEEEIKTSIMDVRLGLLFLLVLSVSWASKARQLEVVEVLISDESGSVVQIKPGVDEEVIEKVARNDNVCPLCEEFTTEAIEYLSQNKTQAEIVEMLHKSCYRIPSFTKQLEIIQLLLKGCNSMQNHVQKCKQIVFEYGPLILANAEHFLETTDVCTRLHACDGGKQASVADS